MISREDFLRADENFDLTTENGVVEMLVHKIKNCGNEHEFIDISRKFTHGEAIEWLKMSISRAPRRGDTLRVRFVNKEGYYEQECVCIDNTHWPMKLVVGLHNKGINSNRQFWLGIQMPSQSS